MNRKRIYFRVSAEQISPKTHCRLFLCHKPLVVRGLRQKFSFHFCNPLTVNDLRRAAGRRCLTRWWWATYATDLILFIFFSFIFTRFPKMLIDSGIENKKSEEKIW